MINFAELNRLANLVRNRMPHNVETRDAVDGRASGRSWYRIEARNASGPAEVYVYDIIGEWGVTAGEFVNELRGLRSSSIDLHVNSEGGEIFDGLAIFEAIAQHPAYVRAYVDGLAASSASFIVQAADERIMGARSRMMIHDGHGLVIGNAADMREMAGLLDDLSNNIADIYAERAGGTRKQWREAMLGPNRASDGTWYDAQAAVAAGLADTVAEGGRGANDSAGTGDAMSVRWRQPNGDQRPSNGRPLDAAMGVHHTATEDSAWDGGAAERAMPSEAQTLRYCYAWRDPNGDPSAKSSYKFPHHRRDGGPANLAAVRNGLARLSGADIDDKDGVRAHLEAHLTDGNDGEDRAHTPVSGALLLSGISEAVAPPKPPLDLSGLILHDPHH